MIRTLASLPFFAASDVCRALGSVIRGRDLRRRDFREVAE